MLALQFGISKGDNSIILCGKNIGLCKGVGKEVVLASLSELERMLEKGLADIEAGLAASQGVKSVFGSSEYLEVSLYPGLTMETEINKSNPLLGKSGMFKYQKVTCRKSWLITPSAKFARNWLRVRGVML